VVDKLALGQVFSEYFVESELNLTPPQETKQKKITARGQVSQSTSLSLENSHSTNCSTLINHHIMRAIYSRR
jgi:hypothetical protein